MSAPNQEIIDALDIVPILKELFSEVKQTRGWWKVLCPFHDDHKPSMGINQETGGYNCLACGAKGNFIDLYSHVKGIKYAESIEELTKRGAITPNYGITTAAYEYFAADGTFLYQKRRVEPGKISKKDFHTIHFPNGDDNDHVIGRGCDAVLYNLPEVISALTVIICEGERKADVVKGFGLVGTTFDSGANSQISQDMIEVLSGKDLIILPDNDEPGRKYGNKIIEAMKGMAKSIKVVTLPDLPAKGDIVDWVQVPGNNKELLLELIDKAPFVAGSKPLSGFVLTLTTLFSLVIPERENIISSWLAAQSICMVYAARGLGKTWFCLALALAVALGEPFFGWKVPKARRVLYIDGEMPTKMYRDRLLALCNGIIPDNLDILLSEPLWLEDSPLKINEAPDQRRIDNMLNELEAAGRNPELIIFDNMSSLTFGMDENSNTEVEPLIRYLISLRHKGYAVLIVHHAGKDGKQRGASRREDILDTSIQLKPVKGDEPALGAKFEIEFSKVRGERPNPDKLIVELISGQHGGLEWATDKSESVSSQKKLLMVIRDHKPKTQKEIAGIMGVKESYITRLVTQANDRELIEKVAGQWQLTKHGRETIPAKIDF